MPLFSRPDGSPADDIPPVRRIMPMLMRTRNEAAVYFEQQLDITETLRFLEAFTRRTGKKVTVFHPFLWAVTRVLSERPRLNRFVMGGRIYQRDGIWLSYSAKKAMNDSAPVVVIKRRFDPAWSFEELVANVQGDIKEGKSDKVSHVDRELSMFLKLPLPVLSRGVGLLRALDDINLLPRAFIEPDPMYASMFVANLGSVRLDAAYHHLYEYGTISLFSVIGRTHEQLVSTPGAPARARTICAVKYTLDERIEDGLYCATSLELLRPLVEDPGAHGA